MEARLLDSLHLKLDGLESKIRAYRGDLITEFHRYYHDLLRDVNPSLVPSIERALVPTLAKYPTLRPQLELEPADSRPPPDNPKPATFQKAQTPLSPRIEVPGSPREREIELQGLFTPSYLPLLDSSPPHGRPVIALATTTATQTTIPFPPFAEVTSTEVDSGTGNQPGMVMDDLSEPGGNLSPLTPQTVVEPGNVMRMATDDSTSSVCSDKSDSKVRRSALRRSSSLSKPPQSPRRVRFEFMGAEVLPTASPQPSEFITPIPSSPFPETDSLNSDTILGDDFEENEPPPRKSSSTEALRALSRAPAEEGTVWTVVNPTMDEALSQFDSKSAAAKRVNFEEKAISPSSNSNSEWKTAIMDSEPTTTIYSRFEDTQIQEEDEEDGEDDDDMDDSSEEGFLSMGKHRTTATKIHPPTSLPLSPNTQNGNGFSTITDTMNLLSINPSKSEIAREQIIPDEDAGDEFLDDMFHFEPGGLSAPPKPRRPSPLEQDEISDDELLEGPQDGTEASQELYASSPAVSIPKTARISRTEPSTPTMSRFQPGSLGSYKGRAIVMPVVRDPDVHARAASLGQFSTFVGGLDGRSGMDEGDLSSFRASVVQSGFSGTPRSFTERFMMEEAQAERQRTKETAQ